MSLVDRSLATESSSKSIPSKHPAQEQPTLESALIPILT